MKQKNLPFILSTNDESNDECDDDVYNLFFTITRCNATQGVMIIAEFCRVYIYKKKGVKRL